MKGTESMKTTRTLALFSLALALAANGYGQSFLTNGLVAYFPFNGNANDASGNGHNGTVVGATLTTDRFGRPNEAYVFGGSATYITAPFDGIVFSNDFTASVWFNASDIPGGWHTLLHEPSTGLGGDVFDLVIPGTTCGCAGPGHLISMASYPGPSFNWFLDRSEQTPLGTYLQVVITKAGTNATMYLNSQVVVTGPVSNPTSTQPGNTFWIGRAATQTIGGDNPAAYAFHGTLDDIRIYNRALSADEVAMLYEYESGPRVDLIKAVKPSFSFLQVGKSYQLQLSGDMSTWTNHGEPFAATNTSMVFPQYWDVDGWNRLFFRLQASP
jgi:hypothetical protein